MRFKQLSQLAVGFGLILSNTLTILPSTVLAIQPSSNSAYCTGRYRNLFAELGYSQAQVEAKVQNAYDALYKGDPSYSNNNNPDDYGEENTRVYYPLGTDKAYIYDVGSGDVRSEGMSYGLMVAVQMDDKQSFDKLWKFAHDHMQHQSGILEGFFIWQVTKSGQKIGSQYPAPDGEVWFATALFLAAARWGNGSGIYNYEAEANNIVYHAIRNPNPNQLNLFDTRTKLIKFSAGNESDYTDPSYNTPGFIELWSKWAAQDKEVWAEHAEAARNLLKNNQNKIRYPSGSRQGQPVGLFSAIAEFDGTAKYKSDGNYNLVYGVEAWRVPFHLAVDYAWFGSETSKSTASKFINFLYSEGLDNYAREYWAGPSNAGQKRGSSRPGSGAKATHAAASIASNNNDHLVFADRLWKAPVPSGKWRYYEGMLYMYGMLLAAGKFQIFTGHGLAAGIGCDGTYPTPTPSPSPEPTRLEANTFNALLTANTALSDWTIQSRMRSGTKVYADRDYVFTQVPQTLQSLEWIQTTNEAKLIDANSLANITVNQDSTVYLAVDPRVIGSVTWLNQWTETTMTITSDEPLTYRVYKRDVQENGSVELSSYYTNDSSFYVVAVEPINADLNECRTLDLDSSNTVDLGDYLILAANFLLTGPSLAGDFDSDQDVDLTDYLTLSENFLRRC